MKTIICICPASPEARLANMARMKEPDSERYSKFNDCILDHRCEVHGEAAQPRVWGRRKELELTVPFKVWEALNGPSMLDQVREKWAGTVGLLCQCSVHLGNGAGKNELRDLIEEAAIDWCKVTGWSVRRLLHRIEVFAPDPPKAKRP